MDKKQLTTYQELQEDKNKLECDISELILKFLNVHGMFKININCTNSCYITGTEIKTPLHPNLITIELIG